MNETMTFFVSSWRTRVGLALWFAVALATSGFAQTSSTNRPLWRQSLQPNIIFILADDLGYGDLGCYGQTKIKTPNLDKLAAEGMRFTSCYAGSTVCAPSRCALLTGFHTGHARIRGNAQVPLGAQDVTVAELLQREGYRTAAIGKWGLGLENTTGEPNRKGFDEWYGYLDQTHAHNYYPDYLWRNADRRAVIGNINGKKETYAPDLFTKAANNFARVNQDRPFFLYLAYTTPHANNELKKATGNGMEVPSDAPYGKEAWPQPEKNKAAMITRLDRDVGLLMENLRMNKLDLDTVIIFTSDNGPHKEGGNDPEFFKSSGPFRGIKRDLYEGGIRVPAIVRWRGKIQPGSVSDQPWAFWDFLPTAIELAGAKPPEKLNGEAIDGISIVPTLLAREQKQTHEFFYWEFHEGGSKQAVRMGDWKGVRLSPDKPLELYNLKSDPAEKENVAAAHADVCEKLESYLKGARTESKEWPLQTPAQAKATASLR